MEKTAILVSTEFGFWIGAGFVFAIAITILAIYLISKFTDTFSKPEHTAEHLTPADVTARIDYNRKLVEATCRYEGKTYCHVVELMAFSEEKHAVLVAKQELVNQIKKVT